MADALAPGLLIAVPQLLDGNFFRSVVFLIEHGNEGAFGVVINRPSDFKVQDLLKVLGLAAPEETKDCVLIGGPVQPERCLILHAQGNPSGDSRPVTPSIFLASTKDSLTRLFASTGSKALCFAGYSGWGPGQLEREIEEGAWIPAPADEVLIFDKDRQGLWDRSLRNLGIDPRFLVRGGTVN